MLAPATLPKCAPERIVVDRQREGWALEWQVHFFASEGRRAGRELLARERPVAFVLPPPAYDGHYGDPDAETIFGPTVAVSRPSVSDVEIGWCGKCGDAAVFGQPTQCNDNRGNRSENHIAPSSRRWQTPT